MKTSGLRKLSKIWVFYLLPTKHTRNKENLISNSEFDNNNYYSCRDHKIKFTCLIFMHRFCSILELSSELFINNLAQTWDRKCVNGLCNLTKLKRQTGSSFLLEKCLQRKDCTHSFPGEITYHFPRQKEISLKSQIKQRQSHVREKMAWK